MNIKWEKYCNLCMEDKLAIASYTYPNELHNERSEILNDYRPKNSLLLGR